MNRRGFLGALLAYAVAWAWVKLPAKKRQQVVPWAGWKTTTLVSDARFTEESFRRAVELIKNERPHQVLG